MDKHRGALAGSVGSALADLIGGFAIWVVPTLIIKYIMALIFGSLCEKNSRGLFAINGKSVLAAPRYIIEDDYDTEFRLVGKPIPSLFSMDINDKVIYMNTFSKSLASTIRISYMALPQPLLEEFNRRFQYLSSTVSTFEQYTLAKFISQGYFERHINRMRNSYKKLRQQLTKALSRHPQHAKIEIIQQALGLYFLLHIHTKLSDLELENRLQQNGVHLQSLQHFYQNRQAAPKHTFVVNYSSIAPDDVEKVVQALFQNL